MKILLKTYFEKYFGRLGNELLNTLNIYAKCKLNLQLT